jgi:hypothetical protein
MHLGSDFQAQRVEPDEAGGVVLVGSASIVTFMCYSNNGGKSLAPCNTRAISILFSIGR